MTLANLQPLERPAHDAKGDADLEDPSKEQPVTPDQFLEGYETGRSELWAYYVYFIGNTGLGLFQFAPTAFQNLLSQATGDAEILYFAGSRRTVNSIVLLANGLSFAIQAVLSLVLGSFADFGTWRSYILIIYTTIAIAVGFG